MNVQLESNTRFILSLGNVKESQIEWVLEQVKNGGHLQGLIDGSLNLPTLNKNEEYIHWYQLAADNKYSQQLAA